MTSDFFFILSSPEADPEGPYSAADLRAMVEADAIRLDAFVAQEGDAKWITVTEWLAAMEKAAKQANAKPRRVRCFWCEELTEKAPTCAHCGKNPTPKIIRCGTCDQRVLAEEPCPICGMDPTWTQTYEQPVAEQRARIARMIDVGCRIKALIGPTVICPAAAALAACGSFKPQSVADVQLFPLKACDRAKYCQCGWIATEN